MTKIVVIDEDVLIRSTLRRLLTLEGYEVVAAESGCRGLTVVREELPSLVLSDLAMPDLDGMSILRALRADAATRDIPFVFVTGSAGPEDIETGLRLGADEYVTKPFAADRLLEVVRRLTGDGHHDRPD